MNWEPVYGEAQPEGGIYSALAREAFQRAGYQLEISFLPWKRALEDAKVGSYAGVQGAVMSAERDEFFLATDSLMIYEEMFYNHSDQPISYQKFEDLKPYTIGHIRGAVSTDIWRDLGITVEEVDDYEQNLKKLMANRIDLMAADKFVMGSLLKKNPQFEGKVEVILPAIYSVPLPIIISKAISDHIKIVEDFNRGLKDIREDGTFDAIVKRFGYKEWH